MWREAEARMDEVTAPPRLEPLADTRLNPRAAEAIEELRVVHDYPEGTEVHGFFATLNRSPELLASFVQMGSDLSTETTLAPRLRELAILRTGWLCGAPYQWGEHARAAMQAGVTAEEVARVREGSSAPEWSPADRTLLMAAEELHLRAALSDQVWADLGAFLDERQMIELLMLVGHYHTTAFVQNALRIPLNPGNDGLLSGLTP